MRCFMICAAQNILRVIKYEILEEVRSTIKLYIDFGSETGRNVPI